MKTEDLNELDLLIGQTIGSLRRLQAELHRLQAVEAPVVYPVAAERWHLAGAELTETGESYAVVDAALRRAAEGQP